MHSQIHSWQNTFTAKQCTVLDQCWKILMKLSLSHAIQSTILTTKTETQRLMTGNN